MLLLALMYKFLCEHINSPKCGIAASYGNSMFNFLGSARLFFQKWLFYNSICTVWGFQFIYPHQCLLFSVCFFFFVLLSLEEIYQSNICILLFGVQFEEPWKFQNNIHVSLFGHIWVTSSKTAKIHLKKFNLLFYIPQTYI